MPEPTEQSSAPTTQDYLFLIFAGVLAHPSTFVDVAGFVDDKLVGSDDVTTATLWSYLQTHHAEPSLMDVAVELTCSGVPNSVGVLERLVGEAEKLTPAAIVAMAQKLARVTVNARRRSSIKTALDSTPLTLLDVEAVASDAARSYPHTTAGIHVLTADDCRAAVDAHYTVIPTGFSYLDDEFIGWLVGEKHAVAARTGDGKSTFAYACVRNQFFAHAVRHREDPYWQRFGSSWDGGGGRQRLAKLLEPCHAGHDHPTEIFHPPHVLWFSLEEPLNQVLGRFYVDLLSLDRQLWMTRARYRDGVKSSHAAEITHINNVLGSGRLTLVDYSARQPDARKGIDEGFVEQTLADIVKKMQAWTRECERRDSRLGVQHPRMCQIDYEQLIHVPDDMGKQDHAVLAHVSKTLRRMAAQLGIALIGTVMLLRDHESNEPNKEQIKGTSQFAQDAARVLTLWPFGKKERHTLKTAMSRSSPRTSTPFDELGDGVPMPPDIDDPDAGIPDMFSLHCQRALHEVRIACDKDRFGPEWYRPLAFDGRHARVTEALPDVNDMGEVVVDADGRPVRTSYREHAEITALLKPTRKKVD